MTAQPTEEAGVLSAEIAVAHAEASAALDQGRVLDAIVWLSAHLASVHQSVHPHVRSDDGRARLRRQHRLDLELERLLRIAERASSGDALAAGLDRGKLVAALHRALAAHADAELRLVSILEGELGPQRCEDVVRRYRHALEHAPTRPHPHLPHHGPLAGVMFRLEAVRDRALDAMDGRHVPAPRPRREPVPTGRWGRYLLGEMER